MRSTPETKPSRQARGFTLVELMIGMVLGLIVVGGAMALFVTQRATHQQAGDMNNIQNEGRIALDALVRDLRGAGDFSCNVIGGGYRGIKEGSGLFNPENGGVFGFTRSKSDSGDIGGGVPKGGTGASIKLPGQDIVGGYKPTGSVLAVVGLYGMISQLNAAVVETDTTLTLPGTPDVQKGDVLAISDCVNMTSFEVSKVEKDEAAGTTTVTHDTTSSGMGGGNNREQLNTAYKKGATVGRLDVVWWFYAEKGPSGAGLYRMSARDKSPLLVSDRVSSLNLEYFVLDTTTTPSTIKGPQVNLNNTGSWLQAHSVNVTMKIQSANNSKIGGGKIEKDEIELKTSVALRNN